MWSWTILICAAALLALIFYRLLRRPLLAAALAALVSTVAFQALVSVQLGHVDKLWPIAAAVSLFVTAIIATIVTLSLNSRRKRTGQ